MRFIIAHVTSYPQPRNKIMQRANIIGEIMLVNGLNPVVSVICLVSPSG